MIIKADILAKAVWRETCRRRQPPQRRSHQRRPDRRAAGGESVRIWCVTVRKAIGWRTE
jgi:hypothetical protein